MTWTNELTSEKLRTAAEAAISDSRINYLEMLNILSAASIGGMTPNKLGDLKSIYLNGQTLFEDNYLQTISYNVIFTNPANTKWWGGTKFASQAIPLGDLSAASTENSVNYLIGKWFLGTDLPMPVSGGDTATGKASEATYNYKTFNGSLFVNGIASNDINQGTLGDCFLLASLGSIANADPNAITNLFTINANGTYGIRFYNNGSPVYTTVDTQLTTTTSGSRTFARASKDTPNELWVGLVEKAYAQINMQFDVNLAGQNWNGENSFQTIEGGFAQPIKQLLNLNYNYYSSYYQGIPDTLKSNEYYSASASTYKQTLIKGLQSGAIGWLGTWGDTYGSNGKQNFVAGHAFMLLGYNQATDKFIIRNPWGGDGTNYYNPQFETSIESFWNSSVKGLVGLSSTTSTTPTYSYAIENNANSNATAIVEGKSVSFLISRNTSGTSSTIYFSTEAKTAGAGDYQTKTLQAVSFAANETAKIVNVQTFGDSLAEGTETFNGLLFLDPSQNNSIAASQAFIANTSTTNFEYTIATNSNTENSAISEGQTVNFIITRSGTGSSSTIYYSTRFGSAVSDDFSVASKQSIVFADFETSKTISIQITPDDNTEKSEYFYVDVFKNVGDITPSTTATAYIKDAIADPYEYTIISNADTEQKAVAEGGTIKFTIVRSGTGSESTIYASTEAKTASSSDYDALDRLAIHFAPNQTVSTFEIIAKQDWWLETTEAFQLKLFRTATSSLVATTATAYIKDTSADVYNYTISSSASSPQQGVLEGEDAHIIITRSGTGSASTVYLSTAPGTAEANIDYQSLSKFAVNFAAFETQKTVSIKTLNDAFSEESEHFLVNLYRNASDSAYSEYANIYITNRSNSNNYNYTITNNSVEAATAITEGTPITITITRDGSGTASTVYLDTHTGNETAEGDIDYTSLTRKAVTFAAFETSKTIEIATYEDAVKEDVEGFFCILYKNENDAFEDYADYTYAHIADGIEQAQYTYTITSDASDAMLPGREGSPVTLTITRSGTGSASEIYVSTESGTAKKNVDFQSIDKTLIEFSDYETTKKISVQLYQDNLTEGSEFFLANLFKNYSDKVAHSSVHSYIEEPLFNTNYHYTITSNASTSQSAMVEGSSITFTITRDGFGTSSTVYLDTRTGNETATGGSDYGTLTRQALTFAHNETSKTITVDTYQDSLTEDIEGFYCIVYKGFGDAFADYEAYTYAHIQDPVITKNFDYTLSSNASSPEYAQQEGLPIILTITRDGTGAPSTIYLDTHTTNETAKGDVDYVSLDRLAVTFEANETTKTVDITSLRDTLDEDVEGFYCLLYKNIADDFEDYAAYTYSYIADDRTEINYNYTISSNAADSDRPVTEGDDIIFYVTRSGSGSVSTVYLDTRTGNETATGDVDYQTLSRYAVTFEAHETVKEVRSSTFIDDVSEPVEGFYCLVYKDYADEFSDYEAYTYANICDQDPYSIASNATYSTPVKEGQTVLVTVTRDKIGDAATVYLSTDSGTATSPEDFFGLDRQAVTFEADEKSKTIAINTFNDNVNDVLEYFYCLLYTQENDLYYDYKVWTSGFIEDVVSGSGSPYAVSASLYDNSSDISHNSDDSSENILPPPNDLDEFDEDVVLPSSSSMPVNSAFDAIAPLYASSQMRAQDLVFPGHVKGQYGNKASFASILLNGSVVSWGNSSTGGDISSVGDELDGTIPARHIFSNNYAFAALRDDGSIIAWGDKDRGGEIPNQLMSQLNGSIDVDRVFSTPTAFAALRKDGSVITWGDTNYGGNSSSVSNLLNGSIDVIEIVSNNGAFSALRADGSVVSWGYSSFGGDAGSLTTSLLTEGKVKALTSTSSAFAAVQNDGSVVSWGSAGSGGDISSVASSLDGTIDVIGLAANHSAFAALRSDGVIITWGDSNLGGQSNTVRPETALHGGAVFIAATAGAFAAITSDGAVVAWGFSEFGGNRDPIIEEVNGSVKVVSLFATKTAFAALREDGSVVTWGTSGSDTGLTYVPDASNNSIRVTQIFANDYAFAALKSDGSVMTWGDQFNGGNSSSVENKLNGDIDVIEIFANEASFSALRADGTLVSWGNPSSSLINGQVGVELPSVAFVSSINASTIVKLEYTGTNNDEQLAGSYANDRFSGLGGNDSIEGGEGFDASLYLGRFKDYAITKGNGTLTVKDLRTASPDGTDILTNVEKIRFSDARLYDTASENFSIVFDAGLMDVFNKDQSLFDETNFKADHIYFTDQTIDMSYFQKTATLSDNSVKGLVELYIASFNRAPDAMGLNYWGSRLADGMGLGQIAKSFFVQPETVAAYPSSQSVEYFIDRVYNNVLSRSPDGSGMAYWKEAIESGRISKDVFLLAIINGAKAETGSAQDKQTLINKTLVGMDYAFQEGLSNVTWAKDVMSSVSSASNTVQDAYTKTDTYAAAAMSGSDIELTIKMVGIWDTNSA